jgi:hypothetical protein
MMTIDGDVSRRELIAPFFVGGGSALMAAG